MNNQSQVTFESGVGTVTGANFLVKAPAGAQILIDCGLVQGEKMAEDANREPFPYNPADIQALIITHAHLDHVGRIPILVRQGFRGRIYSTTPTRELAELVLNDAVGLMANEAKQEGKEPLYSQNDVDRIWSSWQSLSYHQETVVAPEISVMLKDAGHILGSAMAQVTLGQGDAARKILFSGDLGNSPHPLLCDTETPDGLDYLVMESTYGDRNHDPHDERVASLKRVVLETLARGGTLVIPSFAIDRTQVLLYELNQLVEKGAIPKVPVFVDSPMAIKATEVYRRYEGLFNESVRSQIRSGDDPFNFAKLEYTMSQGESRDIERMHGAKIILAGSGMSVGGRVIAHEEHYLPDARNTLLLVGYQAAGSLGRELAEGARSVRIHGRTVSVKAKIETIYGFSGHKDADHLAAFAAAAASPRLRQIFVVMGEPSASTHLAQRLNAELTVEALVPERGIVYKLV